MESLNFDLKKGKFIILKFWYNLKIIIGDLLLLILKICMVGKVQLKNYLVKFDAGKLNLDKVSNLFKNCEEGYSDLSFLVEINNYEIVIESKKSLS